MHPEKQPHNFLELIDSATKQVPWTDEEIQLVEAIRQQAWGNWQEITQSLSGGQSLSSVVTFAQKWKDDLEDHPKKQPQDFLELTGSARKLVQWTDKDIIELVDGIRLHSWDYWQKIAASTLSD